MVILPRNQALARRWGEGLVMSVICAPGWMPAPAAQLLALGRPFTSERVARRDRVRREMTSGLRRRVREVRN